MDSETIKVILVALTPVMLALIAVLQLVLANRQANRVAAVKFALEAKAEQDKIDKEEVRLAVRDVADKAVVAVGKVEEVKQTLNETTKVSDRKMNELSRVAIESQKTGEAIHVLVNSSMSAQLKISMIALRRIAEMTSNQDDKAAASLAEKLFHEHEGKQAQVDSGVK